MASITATSFYLTERDQELLAALQGRYGISRSAVIRMALERLNASEEDRSERLVQIAEEIKRLA